MPARIIVFVTPKGGTGKTTLAVQIGASLKGRVLLLDADPQQSAQQWGEVAPDDSPLPMSIMGYTGNKIHREIKKVIEQFDYILVDCPPSALSLSVSRSALLAGDIALIPVVPSPLDIWEATRISGFLDEVNEIREGGGVEPIQTRLVINKLKTGTTFGKEIKEALEGIGIPALKTAIREREAYKHAALYGTSVHNVPRAKAASEEIIKLTAEIVRIVR